MLTHTIPNRREEAFCGGLPCRPRQGTALRRRSEPRPDISVEGEPQQGLRQSLDVARFEEESFVLILGQVREVPGPPPDDGEAESHRLAPNGPVRLAGGRKDESVRRTVKACNILAGNRAMRDDAADKVCVREARPHARCVTCIGQLVAGEVQRRRIGWKARERLEELEDPLSRQPVGDREEGGPAPASEVLDRTFWRTRHVSSRGDDSNPRPHEPRLD
jgi:hypothetical protein